MRHFLLLLIPAIALATTQSVSVSSGNPGVTLPASAPWTTIAATTQPLRWEMRVHGFGANFPANGINLGPFHIYANVGAQWVTPDNYGSPIIDTLDPLGSGLYIQSCCSGRSDVVMRVQRDVVNLQWSFEICDTTGGNCQSATATIITLGGPSLAGVTVGPNVGEDVAFVRWFSTVVPVGTTIPVAGVTGDLGDWEFEGNLNDSSSHSLNMSGGVVTYVSTPSYYPICNAGAMQSFRSGYSGTLNGIGSTPLDGGSTLTYLWSQSSGPTVIFSSTTISQPTLTSIVNGSYTFALTVTDGSSQQSSCAINDGAVTTDNNGVVITGNSAVDTLIGPLLQYGKSPWPWYDNRAKADADVQIAHMDSYYGAWWNTADAGTITVTQGSSTVTGIGTSFKATFCGGGTTGVNGLVVWYLTGNSLVPGERGRRGVGVTSCTSDTLLTLSGIFANDISGGSGLSYGDDTLSGTWNYNSAPANYYDNVVAFYSLYYRSGIIDYLNAARKLADRFWTCPNTDRGESYVLAPNTDSTNGAWPNRSTAMMGLVLRALDGHSEMWPGLYKISSLANYQLSPGSFPGNQTPMLWDVREVAYELAEVSYCALDDVDPTRKSTCQGWVNTAITNYFTSHRFANGSWQDFSGVYDLATSVYLTHGSTAVTGTGTTWTSAQFQPYITLLPVIWFTSNPSALPTSNSGGDSTFYTPTWVDGTHLKLDRPYEGTTGTHGWMLGSTSLLPIVGYGALPYMEGLLAESFDLAAQSIATSYPASSLLAHSYSLDAAQWIMTTGYRAAIKSVYYAAGYVNCQAPITEVGGNNPCTNNFGEDDGRVIGTEAIGGIARAYAYSGNSSLKTFVDTLYNGLWAKPGTCPGGSPCVPDGYYGQSWDDGGWYMIGTPPVGKAPKWFGQMAGFPGLASWPAIRGAVTPPTLTPRWSGSKISGSQY